LLIDYKKEANNQDAKAEAVLLEEIIDERVDYRTKERGYGQGDCRLGTTLEMSDDIYSLAFVCWLSNDAINKYFDVLKGELKDEA
jgi:hypothetical protein